MKIVFAAIATLASISIIDCAFAQSPQSNLELIEEVFVTGKLSRYGATKSTTPVFETVRSVSIETEEMFRDKGALTLDDALNYTSGVVGDTFGYSTRGDFPQVRGFDAAEYRDGSQVLFGFYNNTRSDVYMLEQVEVLKGPASGLYGKGTPGGIVNATSKLAGGGNSNELIVDLGTFSRYQGAVDLNHSVSDKVHLRLVGLYRDSDTQVDFVEDDAQIIMPSITYETQSTQLSGMVEVVNRKSDTAHQFLPLTGTGCVNDDVKVSPTSICANASGKLIASSTFVGEPEFNRYDTESILVSLLGAHEVNKAFSLEGTARFKNGEADYRQAWISFAGAGTPRIDVDGNGFRSWYQSHANSKQAAFDLRARLNWGTDNIKHELLIGSAYQDIELDNDSNFEYALDAFNVYEPSYSGRVPPFDGSQALPDGPKTSTDDLGFYINDQISISRARINIGLRYDDVESKTEGGSVQKDDAITGNLGFLYAFDTGFSPYVSYAESFEPVIGNDGFTNQPLKPRAGEQIEAGFKYQPIGTRSYITVAYFEIEESNLPNPATLVGQPNSQQEGIATVEGFELEAQNTIGNIYMEFNLSLLDTETPNGISFDSIPEKQASAWAQYSPSSGALFGVRFGLGLRYASENESNGIGASGPVRVVTDGYLLADLLLGYEVNDWDFSLNVRNLNNDSYYGTCLARGDCFPGEERTVVARVAKTF